jgi:chemotaxis protein methyltransferase CheR
MNETLDRSTFDELRRLVYAESGIALGDNKDTLVSARMRKRLRELGLSDPRQYLQRLQGPEASEEIVRFLDAVSTNVTHFFREAAHFDELRAVAAQSWAAGQRRFRFWSAASSTGQEPYSMAMTLADELGLDADWRILATDISTRVLAQAQAGAYVEDKLEGLPTNLRARWFEKASGGDEPRWVVKAQLKRKVLFRRMNLSRPPFPMDGPLDVIFCRNVMIYFDNDVRRRLLSDLYRLLRPHGLLMVGHAESLTGMVSEFKTVRPSVYTRP